MTETRKAIAAFEVVDHGICHEQYFQGCGVCHTAFDEVVTGMGDNPREAVDDALEQLACNGYAVENMEYLIAKDFGRRRIPAKPRVLRKHGDEAHYYLSIRVR